MKITIDSREQSRIQTATDYYTNQGLEVEIAELPIGDYLFSNDNGEVVFEFKLISDFISSIQDNRVFNQAISQSEEYNHHFVIIHGDLYNRHKCLSMTKNYHPITIYGYLGAIASLNKYTTVIETYNPTIQESYYRMLIQANKCLSTKPIVKKFSKKSKNASYNFLCHDIYGINHKKAQLITDTYQLESLTDLLRLTKEDLLNIEGIGEKTARNILEALHGSQD